MSIANLLIPNHHSLYTKDIEFETPEGTPSKLNAFENKIPFSVELGGAVVNVNLNGSITRINNLVIISLDTMYAPASGANSSIYTLSSVLPDHLKPHITSYSPVVVDSGSGIFLGCVVIQNNGVLDFYQSYIITGFATSGNNGIREQSIIYKID